MRLRHIKGCEEFVNNHRLTVSEPEKNKGRWQHPIHVEIGMGKGMFLREMARLHSDIYYLGIERYESVIQKAIERKEKDEQAGIISSNINFVCMDAEKLADVFEKGEVDRIYLNFSDPWPKARHENRRLTSPRFMKLYDEILRKDGTVEFKTDNEELFDYSLESIPASGWKLIYVSRDLHSENVPNVMTEYEKKFSSKGNPIFKLIACR
ncbi:MAG: tRNA (guanosine(46)-N7)-methyltransferase TrmB [Lachnospiraceae bacterium]|nr:tRNA (guanosine(46)-N7)-methyltransferase TrmB [Lachnospiraceae bacterium]